MRVYIDTEFTSFNDPRLVALGAVTMDGRHFYGVVTDSRVQRLSAFVREVVLPLLDAHPPNVSGSHIQVAIGFTQWLAQTCPSGEICDICADYEVDLELAKQLVDCTSRVSKLPRIIYVLQTSADNAFFQASIDEFFAIHPERNRHNALDDALALRFATNKQPASEVPDPTSEL